MRAAAEAPVASERAEVDLGKVESALNDLLGSYRTALQFAADIPLLGHSEATERRLPRWGSRPFTRVYVETHVRKHLQAIRDCLRLERLGRQGKDEIERIKALEKELDDNLKPLFRWRRAAGLLARVPPLAAAALPILSAASLVPAATDVVSLRFVVVMALIVLGFWILVVWPSIRLGFRVKRVIFTGGIDYADPFSTRPKTTAWTGFKRQAFYEDEKNATRGGRSEEDANDEDDIRERLLRRLVRGLVQSLRDWRAAKPAKPFPSIEVYAAENRVYEALGRRKPVEVPLDMLFGFLPYFMFALSTFLIWGAINAGANGDLAESPGQLAIGLVVVLGTLGLPLYARGNYRRRPH